MRRLWRAVARRVAGQCDHGEQLDRMERLLAQIIGQGRKTHNHLTRVEQEAHNRRLLERERADHPFEAAFPGPVHDYSECGASGCVLPKRQHPEAEEGA